MLKKLLGTLWALPVTLLGWLFVWLWALLFRQVDIYSFDKENWCLILIGRPGSWISSWIPGGHGGAITVGSTVFVSNEECLSLMPHEIVHIHQCWVFGIFWLVLYFLCHLGLLFMIWHDDRELKSKKFSQLWTEAYLANPFEKHAEKVSGI